MRVIVEKLVGGGQGLARHEGQVILVWGALPGEEVEIIVTKQKKNFLEGVVKKIYISSPDRVEQFEEHFLCCSPWQILNFRSENLWKSKIAQETFKRVGGMDIELPKIIFDENREWYYRNKMRYHLKGNEGSISLGLAERAGSGVVAITRCALADKLISIGAENILNNWLNKAKIKPSLIDQLVIRTDTSGEIFVGIFLTTHFAIIIPELISGISGMGIYAPIPDTDQYKEVGFVGKKYMVSKINEVVLEYGILSFFQVNIPIFEKVVQEIGTYLDPRSRIIDLYGGVGAISIPLHHMCASSIIIEENKESVIYAQKNIENHGLIDTYKVKSGDAAKILTEVLEDDHVVIMDPPRAGLDSRVVDTILDRKPKKLIYLSCDIATQARDIKLLLAGGYRMVGMKLYNFFPKTPHIESLILLEK